MTGPDLWTQVTLRALEGEPLMHEAIRNMVIATAEAIAERQGVKVEIVEVTDSSLTARINAGRIEAMGFAAELRRLTTSWYTHKFGVEHLWGKPEAEQGEEWKRHA